MSGNLTCKKSKSKKKRKHEVQGPPNQALQPPWSPYLVPSLPPSWYLPSEGTRHILKGDSKWLPREELRTSSKDGVNEYMVNALRSIYNNDDGSIEIERVKVQRRSGMYDNKLTSLEYLQNGAVASSSAQASVPASVCDNHRPPPRRKRKKITSNSSIVNESANEMMVPQWYCLMPYPSPCPFPFPYNYPWTNYCQMPSDESESWESRSNSAPPSPTEHKVESEKVRVDNTAPPPTFIRSSTLPISVTTTSQGTADVEHLQSSSMKSFFRKKFPSRATDYSNWNDSEMVREWMKNMQKLSEDHSDLAGDRSSFFTAHSDVPTPPLPKKRSYEELRFRRKKSNSESAIDNQQEFREPVSPPLLSNTRVSDTDLIYAFKKLEVTADIFKMHAEKLEEFSTIKDSDRIESDLHLQIDSDTLIAANESTETFGSDSSFSVDREISYKWILKTQKETRVEDEEIISKTAISNWRRLLVESLSKGQGLDGKEWSVFQKLVQCSAHIESKLGLLNAQRICSQNSSLGIAFLRNCLLYLTSFGEMLLMKEGARPQGWKVINFEEGFSWSLVKGAMEILSLLGFRHHTKKCMRFCERYAADASLVAQLTLDILILAEEFRLYLTGSQANTVNVTRLFIPLSESPFVQQNVDNFSLEGSLVQHLDVDDEKASQENPSSHSTETAPLIVSTTGLQASTFDQKEDFTFNTDESTKIESTDLEDNTGSIRRNISDNPVDHIYEEITDVKAQIRRMRRFPRPPPIPPKTKKENTDSEIYFRTGSVSSRRKRMAPMPPSSITDFSEESKDQQLPDAENVGRETPSKEEKVEIKPAITHNYNPFDEERPQPSGYVGKNPFYEEVKKRVPKSMKLLTKDSERKNIENSVSHKGNVEINRQSILRPERRKFRYKNKPNNTFSSTNTLHQSSKFQPNTGSNISSQSLDGLSKTPTSTKNLEREQQGECLVAVPNKKSENESAKPKMTTKKSGVIVKEITISYDIILNESLRNEVNKLDNQLIDSLKIKSNCPSLTTTAKAFKRDNISVITKNSVNSELVIESNSNQSECSDDLSDASVPSIVTRVPSLSPDFVPSVPSFSPGVIQKTVSISPEVLPSELSINPEIIQSTVSISPEVVPSRPSIRPEFIQGVTSSSPEVVASGPSINPEVVQSGPSISPEVVQSGSSIYQEVVQSGPSISPEIIQSTVSISPEFVPSGPSIRPEFIQGVTSSSPEVVSSGPSISPEVVLSGPSISPEVIQGVTSSSPEVVQSGPSISPEVVQSGSSISPEVVSSGPSISPEVVQRGSSISPEVVQRGSSISPEVVQSGSSISPEVVSSGPYISPEVVQRRSSISPEVVLSGPSISPEVVQSGSSISPEVVQSGSSISPEVVLSGPSISPEVIQGVTSSSPEVVQSRPSISPEVVQSGPSISPEFIQTMSSISPESAASEHSISPESAASGHSINPEFVAESDGTECFVNSPGMITLESDEHNEYLNESREENTPLQTPEMLKGKVIDAVLLDPLEDENYKGKLVELISQSTEEMRVAELVSESPTDPMLSLEELPNQQKSNDPLVPNGWHCGHSEIDGKSDSNSLIEEVVHDDDNIKENVMFIRNGCKLLCHMDSGSSANQKVPDEIEERYEIPESLLAEAHLKSLGELRPKSSLSPERPCRHRYLFRPPPIPSRAINLEPPPLPPKGTVKSCLLLNFNSCSSLHLPTRPKSASEAYNARPALCRPSRKVTRVTYVYNKEQRRNWDQAKSMSTPSSPRGFESSFKRTGRPGKLRKSWSFQLCDCIYSNPS